MVPHVLALGTMEKLKESNGMFAFSLISITSSELSLWPMNFGKPVEVKREILWHQETDRLERTLQASKKYLLKIHYIFCKGTSYKATDYKKNTNMNDGKE